MTCKPIVPGDEKNADFVIRENIAQHKAGFDQTTPPPVTDDPGNHRFRRADPKTVPQQSLAEIVARSARGG